MEQKIDNDSFIHESIKNFNYKQDPVEIDYSGFKGYRDAKKSANKWLLLPMSLIASTSSLKRKLLMPKDTAWKEGKSNGVSNAVNDVKRLYKFSERNFLDHVDLGRKFLNLIQQAKANYDSTHLDESSAKSIRIFEEKRMYLYTLICLWEEYVGIKNE